VGTSYGASLFGINNNKRIFLEMVSDGNITDIQWLDGNPSQIITSNQSGDICLYKVDTNANSLKVYKRIPYPVNPQQPKTQNTNPSVNNFCYYGGKLTAGYLSQIYSWDTTGWEKIFQVNQPAGKRGNGRAMMVEEVQAGGNKYWLAVDRDSIQGYTYGGSRTFQVPFYAGDAPVEMTYGISGFPFIAISTEWDRCLVYRLDSANVSFIGNFSNHKNSVSSVDAIIANDRVTVYLATGSSDKTVEIWRNNTNYRP
jgi:WD40 repeat protein